MRISTASASTPRSRSPCGGGRAGSDRRIREAGSSGTAATTWAAGPPTTRGRSGDGGRSRDTWRRFGSTARKAISSAGGSSGRLCCIGRMTAAHSNNRAAMARHSGRRCTCTNGECTEGDVRASYAKRPDWRDQRRTSTSASYRAMNGSRMRTPRRTCASLRSSVQSTSHPNSAAA